jgi:hypothetical protein
MAVNTHAVTMDEKNPRISDSSLSKEEAGIVEEHFDKVTERAYGTYPTNSATPRHKGG